MFTFKKEFPAFNKANKMVYLDNAATTQICEAAITAMDIYNRKHRANVHRGLYPSAIQATDMYEHARNQVAQFINAQYEEIIFTSGTTQALNQLAYSLSPRLSHRDNVVLTRLEHHANLVPWQQMAKHYGFEIRFIELTKKGEIDLDSAFNLIDANTKIVSMTLVSNVLGTITPAAKIIDLARTYRAITIIDAAQAAAHMPIDVKKFDCDFLTFSGHKTYGPTGIGVLYGKKVILEEHLEPFFFGGDMVKSVSYANATWNDVPYKFEAGTPNIAGAIGLGAALEWLQSVGLKKIMAHEQKVTAYALKKLTKQAVIIGPTKRLGILSFTIPRIHPHDIAEILGRGNICVRAGNHCAEPLHTLLGLSSTARVSFGMYNTVEDVNKLMAGLTKVKKLFK